MKAVLLINALLAMLTPVGCGDSESSTTQRTSTLANTKGPGPTIEIPKGPPPRKLVIEDLKEGSGKAARKGDVVTVQYVGAHLDGTQYSNSWTYEGAPSFVVGSRQLERGFDLGLHGMKAGGRRYLIVPPKLTLRPGFKLERRASPYGDTLVFVVDMLAVDRR